MHQAKQIYKSHGQQPKSKITIKQFQNFIFSFTKLLHISIKYSKIHCTNLNFFFGNASPKKHLLSSKLFLLLTKLTPMKEIRGKGQHQALGIVRRLDKPTSWASILDKGVAMVETLTPHCQNNLRKPFGICKLENRKREILRK